ncbi:interferon regulatory factor 3 [Platysternon megacephalum]|uniref:Interferon regulatory factor 3 n=1 Tax=Platysternon megacephalum TaxID=55544 RepID=A0A4D9DLG6_9SAUR|nr:interferon regulatory factor 3 [Platysternon megacephalum]
MASPGALWESPGSQLDQPQLHPECLSQEEEGKGEPARPHYELLCIPTEKPQPLQETGHQRELLCDIKEEPPETAVDRTLSKEGANTVGTLHSAPSAHSSLCPFPLWENLADSTGCGNEVLRDPTANPRQDKKPFRCNKEKTCTGNIKQMFSCPSVPQST